MVRLSATERLITPVGSSSNTSDRNGQEEERHHSTRSTIIHRTIAPLGPVLRVQGAGLFAARLTFIRSDGTSPAALAQEISFGLDNVIGARSGVVVDRLGDSGYRTGISARHGGQQRPAPQNNEKSRRPTIGARSATRHTAGGSAEGSRRSDFVLGRGGSNNRME
jgi:hypothetical protein